MQTSDPIRKPGLKHTRSRGVALVITLAMLLLLAFVVIAFFSRVMTSRQIESSSASAVRAEILAKSAADTIISDLRAEIAAGSTRYPATPDDSQPVYLPTDNQKAVPSRVLAVMGGSAGMDTGTSAKMYANLVKQSVGRFFPGAGYSGTAPIIQSDTGVRTDVASQNGRTVGWAQWQAPGLTPAIAGGGGTGSPFGGGAGFTDSAHLPRWLIMTRQGVPAAQGWSDKFKDYTPGNREAVIGRFAFNVYDEGGLLDVNAVGFPTGAPTNLTAADKSQDLKATLTGADLSVIPGVETSTNADKFAIAWRYLKSKTDRDTFLATWRETAQAGFLRSGTGDNITYGRQDLIRLAKKGLNGTVSSGANGTYGISVDSLPYLTSFSRDLEQPSFFPDPNRPKNFGADGHKWYNTIFSGTGYGGNNAYVAAGTPKQDSINPALLTVRASGDQPVVKRRFALNRLAWLTHKGAWADQNKSDAEIAPIYHRLKTAGFTDAFLNQGTAENIKRYFGLKWDPINFRWLYVSPDGNSVTGVIKTLAQIAAVSPAREPDFFETLYAVICCDALGKQQGVADYRNRNNTWSPHCYIGDAGFVAAAIDGSVEFQIMQIGAGLIDQFDADSFPTCVAFDDPGTSTTRPFYGVENLPYLAGWMNSWYRMKTLVPGTDFSIVSTGSNNVPPTPATMGTGSVFETWSMVQPIIWNPHAPDSGLEMSLVPTQFRVLATSVYTPPPPAVPVAQAIRPEVWPSWWSAGRQSSYPAIGGMTDSTFSDAVIDGINSYIEFNITPNATPSVMASFQEPHRLLYNYPPGSNALPGAAYTEGTLALGSSAEEAALIAADTPNDATAQKRVIGFFTGKCWTGPSTYNVPAGNVDSTRTGPECLTRGSLSDNLQLQLHYQTSDGRWIPYDVCNQVRTFVEERTNFSIVDNTGDAAASRTRGFRTAMRVDPRTNRWGLVTMNTFPTALNPGSSNTAPTAVLPGTRGSYHFPQGTTLNPNAGFTAGVVYRANNGNATPMAGWTNLDKISNVMVNLSTLPLSGSPIPDSTTFYTDPDGVLRRASGGFMNSTPASPNNNGLPMATGNHTSRPVVLNRPFYSIVEMGYAFSGTPWKELDFFSPESGYAALLDAFCLRELDAVPGDVIVAGRVNLNTRQPKVLQALIQGGSKAEGGILNSTEAAKAAQALVDWTTADPAQGANQIAGVFSKGPLRNRSELVGRFVTRVNGPTGKLQNNLPTTFFLNTSYSGYSSMLTSGTGGVFSNDSDAAIKRRRESVLRTLADSGNTRTWNLLIDLIAQTGRYPLNAKTADKFVVEGESRFWVHLAIDRYTGNIVAKQMEPVAE